MQRRGSSVILAVMLLCVCGTLAAQEPEGAYAVPASDRMIRFELDIEGISPVELVVQDGDFARVSGENQTYAVAPIITKSGAVDFMILEIGTREKGRETLHQREYLDDNVVGVEVLSKETGFIFKVIETYDGQAHSKMRKSCDRCCIYCNGWQFCACAVSTECGSCCCTDCCDEWPRF